MTPFAFHDEHIKQQSTPAYFGIVDYADPSWEPWVPNTTLLWNLADEDTATHPFWLADLGRELQLALDLTGNLDAPQP
jgi:hypothetical protein